MSKRIEHQPYNAVCLRVVARIIQMHYVKHKEDFYPSKGEGILKAYDALHNQFVELRPFFHYYARNVVYGYNLVTLRDNPPMYTMRSIAKLKPRQRRSQ